MKNISQRYGIKELNLNMDTNKLNINLSIMVVMCIKQYLSNIWSTIMKKSSNTEAELKKALLIKNRVFRVSACY